MPFQGPWRGTPPSDSGRRAAGPRRPRRPRLALVARLVVVAALFGATLSWQGVSAKTVGPTAASRAADRPILGPSLLRQTTVARAVAGWLAITTTLSPTQPALRTGTIAIEVDDAHGRRVGRRVFGGLALARGQGVRRSFWWPAPITGRYQVALRVHSQDGAAALLWVPQAAEVAVVVPVRLRGSSWPPTPPTGTALTRATLIPPAAWVPSGSRPRPVPATSTGTASATATATATPSPTSTATSTHTGIDTATATSTATATPTSTATPTDTATPAPFSGALTDRTTASPGPVSPGGPVTITAVITDTVSALDHGIIDIEVYDAHDVKVGQQAFTGQTIEPGQSAAVTYSWPGGASGFYRVTVGVFAAGWSSMLLWNDSAAFFGVGDTSVTFSQSTVVSGAAPVSITTTITDTSGALVGGILDIEVHAAGGALLNQQSFPGQSFTPGQAVTETISWTPPGPGNYEVTVGVFSPWWVTTLFWDNGAAPVTIGP